MITLRSGRRGRRFESSRPDHLLSPGPQYQSYLLRSVSPLSGTGRKFPTRRRRLIGQQLAFQLWEPVHDCIFGDSTVRLPMINLAYAIHPSLDPQLWIDPRGDLIEPLLAPRRHT